MYYGEGKVLAVRLPVNLENKLNNLSKRTDRPKSYYVCRALEEFFAAHEDYLLAVSRLEKNNPRISIEEMEHRLGLDNTV